MSERNRDFDKVKYTYDGFDENSPRPPVPGEENAHCSSSYMPQMEIAQYKLSSPTPCRNYYPNESCTKMGCESEGKCKSITSRDHKHGALYDNPSIPSCYSWATSLDHLLQDLDGVKLFLTYLDSEKHKKHKDALNFWFACEGLRKNTETERVKQYVKIINNKYIIKKKAFDISEDVRKRISKEAKRLIYSSDLDLPVTIFDEIQTEVYHIINKTTYPNFLQSNIYLQHLNNARIEGACGDSNFSNSCSINKEMPPYLSVSVGLPTVHEDKEFIPSRSMLASYTPGTGSMSTGYHTPNVESSVRLTKNFLLATESQRLDVRPKPEAYAEYLVRGKNNYNIYNSYNPVTRQGSELQSLSSQSDARTESDMSFTDKSVDDNSLSRASYRKIMHAAEKQQAMLNKNAEDYHIIPRTQMKLDSKIKYEDPAFMEMLSKKLEKLKRDQDQGKTIWKKCRESDSAISIDEMEKLRPTLDDDQCILDEHVQRVFSDGSPGFASPCRPQMSKARWHLDSHRQGKKDKDGVSLFSSDSGNVHDFYDGPDHRMSMVKSKSMEDRDKFTRGMSSRKSSRRTTDATQFDSGISVVSDSLSQGTKDFGVLGCTKKLDMSYSEMSAKHSRHRKASRSNSIERSSAMGNLEPAQPFVADPNMPPLPLPNTSIQLEEARRRLEDNMHKQKFTNKYMPDSSRSAQSTLNKLSRSKPVSEECTSVIFSFWDEEFPYLIKIPGRQITLKQLKENLPKKGNYRFFFKTECAELDNQVIQEEVRNDSEVVPLFEGKVMVQGKKPVD